MADCHPVTTQLSLSCAFIVVYFCAVKMEAGRKPLTLDCWLDFYSFTIRAEVRDCSRILLFQTIFFRPFVF